MIGKTKKIKLDLVFKVIIGVVAYLAISFFLTTFLFMEWPKIEAQVFAEKGLLHTFSLFSLILQTIIWTGILFVPGYFFSKALFPEIFLIERVLLSFAFGAFLSFLVHIILWFLFTGFFWVVEKDFYLATYNTFARIWENEGKFNIGGALFFSMVGFLWWKVKTRKTKITKDYNPPTASSHSPKGERAPEKKII